MQLTDYSAEKVRALYEAALAHPELIEPPEIRHFFAEGVYGREMYMPAGLLVIGKRHLKQHLCVVLGDVSVYSPEGVKRYEGYHTFTTQPGEQRTLFAHDATWWTTIHANPDNCQDLALLEARNVVNDFEALQAPPAAQELG